MNGLNKVHLIGNLGKAPEIRVLEGDVKVASMSLATSEPYKDKSGEKITKTSWHNLVMWRGLAEVASRYLTVGSSIYVEGKIQYRDYEDKEGIKRRVTEIVVSDMIMLSRGKEVSEETPAEPNQEQNTTKDTEDGLPF